MQSSAKFRFLLQPVFAALVLLSAASGRAAQFGGHRGGGGGMAGHPAVTAVRPGAGQKPNAANQDHLKQWMNRHNSPAEQQRALEKEPGFHDLPQQTQQRFRDKLNQLNNMPPEQRRRTLERAEMMERLTPDQRLQLRGSVQQLGRLPDDRRRLVARAFRDLREMPVPQRQAILSSDRFRSQFSDQERGTLSGLLAVEPYIPVERPNTVPAPAVGK